ncbi:winged helix-turn-helix transcriptional regulator [Roseomonas fluvialis]|uniref:winged helix-turn-helix transcriptional regulator n=1 Tax=Roseomonas fluvialis TaxID=1750527 RepID=UPI001FCD3F35|nr:helix-turn-helix domain-containing protein [Roseomonas fluvialis]
MPGYGQFCPVAKTCELFAERWTPLIVRELCCGPAQFNDLRRRLPLMSKTLLAQRLRDLEHNGIVSTTTKDSGHGNIYALTQAGEEFRPIIAALSLWGQRHTQHILRPEDFDPHFLLQSVVGQIPREACPAARFVIRFDFRNIPAARTAQRSWWIVLMHPHIDLCMKDPGHAVDLVIAADIETFTRAWMGYLGLAEETARRGIGFEGPPEAVERAKALMGLFDRARERRFTFAPPEMLDA